MVEATHAGSPREIAPHEKKLILLFEFADQRDLLACLRPLRRSGREPGVSGTSRMVIRCPCKQKEGPMIGKLIGALIGAQATKRMGTANEPGGALFGAAAVAVARRFGLPGMIAAAIGGYALKRYSERQNPGLRNERPS